MLYNSAMTCFLDWLWSLGGERFGNRVIPPGTFIRQRTWRKAPRDFQMTQHADLPLVTTLLWHRGLYFMRRPAHSNNYVRQYDLKQSFITQQSLNTIFIKSFPQKGQKKGEVHSRGIKTISSFCFKVTHRFVSSNHTRYTRMFCDTIKAQCCYMF